MNLDLGKVLADAPNVNIKAYGNALLGYLEGFLRVSKPLSYPWKLDIVLTKACNLRCIFCISYGSLKAERWMQFDLYEKIARRLFLNVTDNLTTQESLFYHPDLVEKVFAESRRRAHEYGTHLELPELPGRGKGPEKCLWPWEFCQIDTDGSIRFCYRSWRQRIGFFSNYFGRLWRGENYQKLRETLESPNPFFPYCQYCPCRLGFDLEGSHIQRQHAESYVIPGLEHLQVPFNQRSEESYNSFVELKGKRD